MMLFIAFKLEVDRRLVAVMKTKQAVGFVTSSSRTRSKRTGMPEVGLCLLAVLPTSAY